MQIDLAGRTLRKKVFQELRVDRSDSDWFLARRNANKFEAFGGAMNLGEMIECFLAWAE